MPRQPSLLPGLVVGVLVGGIVGTAVALLVDLGSAGPGVGVGVGAAVAAGIGYLAAWLVLGRQPRRAAQDPAEPVLDAPGTDRATPLRALEEESVAPEVQDVPQARPTRGTDRPSPTGAGPLAAACVSLAGTATSRPEAIDEVGALLVAAGAVEPGYVEAMHARDRGVSTHMGNLLAVPHGNHDARRLVRRSTLALVRYPDTIDWNGNRVRFVVATAGLDDADQVRLVSRVAEVFLDDTAVARLEAAQTADEVAEAFGAASG